MELFRPKVNIALVEFASYALPSFGQPDRGSPQLSRRDHCQRDGGHWRKSKHDGKGKHEAVHNNASCFLTALQA